MLNSVLIGAIAGARSLTPLAAVSLGAWRGWLPEQDGAVRWLGTPLWAAGALVLAAGELVADKAPSAPERVTPPGLAARVVTGAMSGAAVAPREQRAAAAAVGATAALAAAYLTFEIRVRSMQRFGQTATGLVEDAVAIAATCLIVRRASDERA